MGLDKPLFCAYLCGKKSMFNKDFYPTPAAVIETMIEPWLAEISLPNTVVLDPSAGKGNILDVVKSRCKKSTQKLLAIEPHEELRAIISSKKYSLIGEDFIAYSGQYWVDYILMNPPFANGATHLLKAWSIAKNAKIACLLNRETLDNPYSAERETLLRIIEDNNGTIEYLGKCFSDSERTTDVEVALVRLEKKNEEKGFTFTGEKLKSENIDVDIKNELARSNYIEGLIDAYNVSCDSAREYCYYRNRYVHYSSSLSSLNGDDSSNVGSLDYNEMVIDLNRRAWKTLFEKTDLKKLLTKKILSDWNKFQEHQGNLEFNRKNIAELFDVLILNRDKILQDCLISVFEKMTSYHDKNRIHMEGWATNDAYMVNKKVILPWAVTHGQYMSGNYKDRFNIRHDFRSDLDDIDKAMCLLSGKSMPTHEWKNGHYERTEGILTLTEAMESTFNAIGLVGTNDKFNNTCESEFFFIRFWKKGTLHLEFKDNSLCEALNIEVAKGKNWLPSDYGQSFQRKQKK